MASSFNQVTLVGNLTRDPELKFLQSGTAVCEVGLAVNESRKQSDGSYADVAHFFDVTFWGRTAEVLGEYCAKGAKILVAGRLAQETWEDRDTGKKRSKIKVVCERMLMLGAKGEGKQGNGGSSGGAPRNKPDGGSQQGDAYETPGNSGGGDSGDIPF